MTKDVDPALNGLSSEVLRECLLRYNYFPRQHDYKEELPPIFHTELLTPAVAMNLLKVKERKGGYDVLAYRRTRHPNIPRIMGIPHPRAYVQLVDIIGKNWEEHIGGVCQSPNSQIEFGLHEDNRIVVLKYDHIAADGDVQDQDPIADFGKKYRIKTDITNFFHSIYSHSLPWALVGHTEAKKTQFDKSTWHYQIDRSTRLCQRNETKGIPIGPATSSILSEIILFKVDEELRLNKGYQFSRYIDDYTAYVEDDTEADRFLLDLAAELGKYTLTLNPKKTFTEQMPVLSREEWITDINLFFGLENEVTDQDNGEPTRKKIKFRQLKLIIDKAIALSKEFPDGSVLKYALSAIIEVGIDDDQEEAHRYFQDACLRYSYYFPTLIPLIQRWLPSTEPIQPNEHKIEKRIKSLLNRSFEQGQSDNIVWCIYYLLQMTGEPVEGLLQKCCETNDPMVALMGFVYAKKKSMEIAPVEQWANSMIDQFKTGDLQAYDIDRFWLLMYQLYFEGVISSPPYSDANDNKIFETLKSEGVSFINWEHEDFCRLSRWATKIFGDPAL